MTRAADVEYGVLYLKLDGSFVVLAYKTVLRNCRVHLWFQVTDSTGMRPDHRRAFKVDLLPGTYLPINPVERLDNGHMPAGVWRDEVLITPEQPVSRTAIRHVLFEK